MVTQLPQVQFLCCVLQFCMALPPSASFSAASLLLGSMRAGHLFCCSGVSSLSLVVGNRGGELLLWSKQAENPSMGESCFMMYPEWVREVCGCQLSKG